MPNNNKPHGKVCNPKGSTSQTEPTNDLDLDQVFDDLAAEAEKLPPERQRELLDRLTPGPKPPKSARPRHNRQETSLRAWKAAAPHRGSQEARLLSLFDEAGSEGLIDDEIACRLGMLIQSVCPLRGGLVTAGKVVKTTLLRDTRSGRSAIVWAGTGHAKPEVLAEVFPWIPSTTCQRILDALKAAGDEGLTDKLGAEGLGITRPRYQANRQNLARRGLVEHRGTVVLGERNTKSKVWFLASDGGDA